jgi:hypothetical protein
MRRSSPVAWRAEPVVNGSSRLELLSTRSTESFGWSRDGSNHGPDDEDEEYVRAIAGPGHVRQPQSAISTASSTPTSTLAGVSPFGTTTFTTATSPTSPTSASSHRPYGHSALNPFADPQTSSRPVHLNKPLPPTIVRVNSRGSLRSNGTSSRSFITGDDARSDALPLDERWR